MKAAGWLLAPVVSLLCLHDSQAQQVIIYPVPIAVPAVGTLTTSGIGFAYRRRGLAVGGFTGSVTVAQPFGVPGYVVGPYGQIYYPGTLAPIGVTTYNSAIGLYGPPLAARAGAYAPARDETAGVDLDKVPPPGKQAAAVVDIQPPPPKVELPAPPPRAAAPKAAVEPPPPADRLVESTRLIQLGLTAFTDKEYGLAAQRWRQAAVLDRTSGRARFLLAQAQVALGKYREAVAAIHEGMDLDAKWPDSGFRPRLELYKGNEQDYTTHFKQLQDALNASPDNRFLLFLSAYQQWFDGRRQEAVQQFRQARAATVDTSYIDQFLRAAGAAVAAR